MAEEPNDGFKDLNEFIKKLLEQSFQSIGEAPFGYGFKIIIRDGECQMIPMSGGMPQSTNIERETEVSTIDDEIHIIADMPGVEEDDVQIALDGNSLIIEGRQESTVYHAVAEIPQADEGSMKYTCKNGVVEVIFKKNTTTAIQIN
jgi:HSP20 family molecular chaperone IbpA